MGTVTLNINHLMEETSTTPMDLVRYGISPGAAYYLRRDKPRQISFDMLATLCDFFSEKTGRIVSPGEILSYEPDKESQK